MALVTERLVLRETVLYPLEDLIWLNPQGPFEHGPGRLAGWMTTRFSEERLIIVYQTGRVRAFSETNRNPDCSRLFYWNTNPIWNPDVRHARAVVGWPW